MWTNRLKVLMEKSKRQTYSQQDTYLLCAFLHVIKMMNMNRKPRLKSLKKGILISLARCWYLRRYLIRQSKQTQNIVISTPFGQINVTDS